RVLRAKVSRLRGVLESVESGGRQRVVHGPAGYRMRLEPVELDATRFRELAERARAEDDLRSRATGLAAALELWRGPALAGFDAEPFAVPAAARLEDEYITVAEELAECRLELGEHRV